MLNIVLRSGLMSRGIWDIASTKFKAEPCLMKPEPPNCIVVELTASNAIRSLLVFLTSRFVFSGALCRMSQVVDAAMMKPTKYVSATVPLKAPTAAAATYKDAPKVRTEAKMPAVAVAPAATPAAI